MKYIPMILCVSFLFSANAGDDALKNSALLSLPMDSLDCRGSAQSVKVEAIGKEKPLFAEGKHGKALVCDGEGVSVCGLKLTGKNLYPAESGTIAFWMRPLLDYTQESRRSYFLYWEKGDGVFVFIEKGKGADLYYQTRQGTGWISPHFSFDWWKRPQWNPKSWYHIAVTWGKGKPTVFYVNGSEIFKTNDSSRTANIPETLYIGCAPEGRNSANALLDDFFVFPKILTPAEIQSLL